MSRTWKIRFRGGEVIRGSSDTAYVGQGSQCEIRLANDSEYEDSTYAVLLRNRDAQTWRLVRLHDTADIRINGEQMHLVHYLKENDIVAIAEADAEFRFSTEAAKVRQDTSRIVRRSIWSSLAAVCIVLLVVGLALFIRGLDEITEDHIDGLKNSICKITVTQVQHQQVDIIDGQQNVTTLNSVRLEGSSCSGTGFFCTDGRFITARHCVEPWITMPMITDSSLYAEGPLAKAARWASESETFNHRSRSDSTSYQRVISLCKITSGHKKDRHEFSTDTCMFSIEADIIRNLGGPKDRILWRETGDVKLKSSLGDIAFVQTGIKGDLQIAQADIVRGLERRTQIAHWGYRADSDEPGFKSSEIAFDFTEERAVRCIEHKSSEEMYPGFSGSPAMIRHNGKVYVVGVVSKIGKHGKETFFSVPVTEVEKANRRW